MRWLIFVVAGAALVAGSPRAQAAGCAAGECHKKLVSAKFLHGPVAAEEAGAEGCVSCHVPAGRPCAPGTAGAFSLKTKKERLCFLCHDRGTATQHTKTRTDCLACHNPHASESSKNLLRAAGQGASDKKP